MRRHCSVATATRGFDAAPTRGDDDEEHRGAQADDAEGLGYELARASVEREVPLPLPPFEHVPQGELEGRRTRGAALR